MVENLAEVLEAQAGVVGGIGDAYSNLVALAGVHHAFHVVKPGVDFPLDDGLKVGLHLLAGHLHIGCQGKVFFAAVNVVAHNGDLVILHLGCVLHEHQLGGGVLARPEFHLHVGLADDLALEGGGKGHGDGQLLGLDLDAPELQGLLDGLGVIEDGLQGAGHLVFAQVDVHHHGEAQGDGAGAGGDNHGIDLTKGVHKGGHAVLGVVQERGQVAGLDVAEDQRGADGHGDHVDHGGHIVSQGHHAHFKTHLHAAFGALLDDVAHQEGHDALGLIVLDDLGHILGGVGLAQHHGHAGDIAGDQGHAQGADDGIGHEADAGVIGIGLGAVYILEAFENLRAHSGGETGVERLGEILLIGDEAL